jgi:Tfp pilus assembly pilus retraction ATPase PilT
VEGSDTLVIMTKAQASAMNNKFVQMKKSIDEKQAEYNGMKVIADSLATLYTRSEATLQRERENAPKAIKDLNAEWVARLIFVSWVFTIFIISNG